MRVSQQLLRKKPFIIFGLIWSILIVIGSIFLLSDRARENKKIKNRELVAIGELKTDQLVRWYNERTADIKTIAASVFFRESLMSLTGNNEVQIKSDLKKRLQEICENYQYAEALITDPKGRVLVTTDDLYTFDPATLEHIKAAVRERRIHTSDFYFCRIHQRVHLDFIGPLVDRQQHVIGVLILRVAPERVLFPLLGEWPIPSRSGEVILFRQDGDSIVFLNNLRFYGAAALKLRLPLTAVDNPAVMAIKGVCGLTEGTDYRGVRVLTHINPVPGTNWFLEVKIDQKEIYAEIRRNTTFLIINIITVLILLGSSLAFVYNLRQKETYLSLYRIELKRREMEEQFRAILYSIGDAVIVTDPQSRVRYLNPVAERLTGWTESAAQGKSLTELFQLLNEDDRNPVMNPVEVVLKKGNVINLSRKTLLLTSDGREIPIADSCAAIRDQGGDLIGAVLVFRDQTADRAAERSLLRSETQFRSIWENSRDGMRLCDQEGRIIRVNPAYCQLVGLTTERLEGQLLSVAYAEPYGLEILDAYRENFIKDEIRTSFIREVLLHDGRRIWLEVSNSYVQIDGDKYMLSIFRDITDRKKTVDALEESERRYRALFDGAKDAMMILEPPHWQFTTGNPAVFEIFGVNSLDQFINLRPWELSPEYQPDGVPSKEKALAMIEKAMSQGSNFFEWVHKRYNGENFLATVLLNRINVADKVFLLATVRDISRHRKTEEALSLSERRYASLVEASPAGIFRTDLNGKTTFVSQRWSQISGVKAEDALGDGWLTAVHPQDRDRILNAWEKATQEQCSSTAEYRFIHPDGTVRWVRGHAAPETGADGRIVGYVGVIIDITEEKKAEQAWRESEERYRRLADNAEDIIFRYEFEPRRGFTYISPVVSRICGYTPEEHYADPDFWLRIVYQEDADLLSAIFSGQITKSQLDTIRFIHKNGQLVWVEQKTVPIFSEDGKLIALEGISRDITERKRIEEALHLQDIQLRQAQKMEAIGQLASGIAHDFNNILGIIMGHASLLKRNFGGDQKSFQSIETIEKTSQRGADLVKRLLSLARKSEPVTTTVNISDLLNEVGKLLTETFPKNISVEVQVDTLLPFILADASQLHQVLMNLGINARDAMPQGGKLFLKAKEVEKKELLPQFPDAQSARYIEIEVTDTGTGIEPQLVERIFDPFFTTKAPGKGTGLGLTTVQTIVRNHDGFIKVDSKMGVGTTFRIFLPVPHMAGLEVPEQENTPVPPPRGRETILFIEDEEFIVDLISSTLEAYGYHPLIARDGIEGVRLYQENQAEIAAVITDLGLPGILGDEVLKRIREINRQVPIIIASGYLDVERKNELLTTGLTQFIQKPYMPEELMQKIRELLDKR